MKYKDNQQFINIIAYNTFQLFKPYAVQNYIMHDTLPCPVVCNAGTTAQRAGIKKNSIQNAESAIFIDLLS